MNSNEELKKINIDEFILTIFIISSLFNIYGDEIQKVDKKNSTPKKISLITAIISLIIYIYFITNNYNELKKYAPKTEKYKLQEKRLYGTIFIAIGTSLLIYYTINSTQDISPEIP